MLARILVFLAFTLGMATASAAEPEKICVVIIDGQNNHDWRSTTPILKQALEKSGRFTVDVSSNLKTGDKPGAVKETVPFPPDLDKYQAVVSNYNGAAWPAEFQKSLEDHVKDGKVGFVLFHGANNPFSGWAEFNRMIGMGWRGNKFGDNLYFNGEGKPVRVTKGEGRGAGETGLHPFRVTIRDAEHPITKGMPREWMHAPDQLVHGLRGPVENVHVLATAFSDPAKRGTGEHELMLWTVTYGKGRVFHTPMGHGTDSVRCVGFATALLRGTEWAATGAVTLPVPENFPTADKVSLIAK
jgi:type 1 glutamine amidotransferase